MKQLIAKITLILMSCALFASCNSTQTVSLSPTKTNLVLVTGITGNQGGAVADELLAQGFQVRGLSRNIESDASKALTARGVEMVQGDFTDFDSIDSAVAGTAQMFLNITEQTPNFVAAGINAIDSAYAAGVAHIVFTSNRPADPESGFDVNAENTKRMMELHLRNSGRSYTTLRIPFMMENLMRERDMPGLLADGIVDYGEKETTAYYISSADMSKLAAAAFTDPEAWNGREVNMASDAMTYRELASMLSEISDMEIPFRTAPWSEMRGRFVANFQFFEEADPTYDLEEIRRDFPVSTLREYLISQGFAEKLRQAASTPTPAQRPER